jgi:site-specific DNA-methyltransferase (adenine-specific)
MSEIADKSIHLIITSPPYWQLKDYGDERQIGFHDSYEEYINHLNLVWNKCHRVLHNGCRMCINIGDQFARAVYYGRYKVIPIRTEIIKFCETIGFDYMGAIIWQKVTTCNTTGGATIMGSYPYPRNGIVKLDYEFILIFKKRGKSPRVPKSVKEASKLSIEEWNEYFYGHWNFPGERQDKHLAVFPEELPKRLIRMFSFVGETVLDPFVGSGTTTIASMKLGRNSVGYEINQDFANVIDQRFAKAKESLFAHPSAFEIVRQEPLDVDFARQISKLPYVFKDPVKFDKKIDPRKLTFGSRITGREKRTNLHSVKQIRSPVLIELDDGLIVRLLGVKPCRGKEKAAAQLLRDYTKGQKVSLKFDCEKYDSDKILLSYVYLKNKTFVNRHLVRSGLYKLDNSVKCPMLVSSVRQLNKGRTQ